MSYKIRGRDGMEEVAEAGEENENDNMVHNHHNWDMNGDSAA